MSLFISIFLVGSLLFLSIKKKNVKEEVFFNKISSSTINGFFVMLVFISHFQTYIEVSGLCGIITQRILWFIGQLMVTTFLFFSGYGITASIKGKRISQPNDFLKRLLRIWFPFFIAVNIYIVSALIFKDELNLPKILYSYIAWETIGNSAWYMFVIFSFYLIMFIASLITDSDINFIHIVTCFSLILFLLLRVYKESYWYNTLLCFPFGMYVKMFEDKLFEMINKNRALFGILSSMSFIVMAYLKKDNSFSYALFAMAFLSVIIVVSSVLSFDQKILRLNAKYIFEIYIYQRIFFRLFSLFNLNEISYIMCSYLATVSFAVIIKKATNQMYDKLSTIYRSFQKPVFDKL